MSLSLSSRTFSRRSLLATAAAGAAASGIALTGCGNDTNGASKTSASGFGGSMTWSAWANPGEAKRFSEYTEAWNKKTGAKAKFQMVSGDYASKLMTQLVGGSAPDAFYAGDDQLAKLIQSGSVMPLDDFLASSDATVKFTDHYAGLTKWMKGPDGKVYGLPNDCNPIVMWFNKKLLTQAGIDKTPAEHQEAGTWTLDAFGEILTKTKAIGKTGSVLESGWWGFWMGYITAQGGTMFDESGKAVFDTDPKAQETISWLLEQLKAGTMRFGGNLPKGQGVDALFYGGQLATMSYGRWVLPNLKQVKGSVDYDIAPLPTADGKSMPSVPVGTSSIAVNAKAKNPKTALRFVTDYVNVEGQRARLSGGGNALPTLPGLEDIATEGGDPAHGAWFNELAAKGWGTPKPIYSNPRIATNLPLEVNKLLTEDSIPTMTAKKFAEPLVKLLNS